MDVVVRCADLAKAYGDLQAVDGVSFEVAAGETYGLLGPNGAGKSTTISLLCGLLTPDRGAIEVAGEPVGVNRPGPKRHLGYVPQDLAIYPDLTARENLVFFGRIQGLERTTLRSRVDEVLETTGLADRAGDRADTFSGGMKRRLNIGVGLLHEPQVLVLDEPTVGVDPQSRNAILEAIERLATAGMAVIYTTHYMEEAERLCDRVGIIDEGRLVAEGTRPELLDRLPDGDRVVLQVDGRAADAAAALDAVAATSSVTHDGHEVACSIRDAGQHLPDLLRRVADAGVAVVGVEVTRPDLETVFLHLTGKALRD